MRKETSGHAERPRNKRVWKGESRMFTEEDHKKGEVGKKWRMAEYECQ